MSNRISSFPPVINKDSEILILGSIPGVKSLEMQEYYAHPQNKFWTIIFELFNEDFTKDYQQKLQILKKNKIALWDVIDSCERKGSLDSEIKNETGNDILKLLKDYPNLKIIFCNGQKSYKNLIKTFGKNIEIPIVALPSTSPLHTISFDKKLKVWQQIKDRTSSCLSED
ncbi:G/U mismatch-specific uracil-DNA glycosylase [Soonwooa buanensis]|uniref:G/U mismatch-specific uracil-DNA glycosylase n=1 Tax=Soonwooa buanensis TaxID=619805 RepID=A0A1T5F7F2_9FLAO|nr:DNA-deoxyinosine glycosylase [Soonwooa buanensis]SKB92073.1 G/U mismatch-specific uracil-DNA glycosylase [Soonwooa buanensis]